MDDYRGRLGDLLKLCSHQEGTDFALDHILVGLEDVSIGLINESIAASVFLQRRLVLIAMFSFM